MRAVSSSLVIFLSTLSLRRATTVPDLGKRDIRISIHALLAESDGFPALHHIFELFTFLSTLSLRRATAILYYLPVLFCISIHALLAESDERANRFPHAPPKFLSTLSLRRATFMELRKLLHPSHFYPRSPCGERHISKARAKRINRFLSTLSLRRATISDAPSSAP